MENKRTLRVFDLQLFAGEEGDTGTTGEDTADKAEGLTDGDGANSSTEADKAEAGDGTDEGASKTFSQSELDKAVSKAIETREAKLKAEYEANLKIEVENALKKEKKLSDMTEEERILNEIKEREDALSVKEKQINMTVRKNELAVELAKLNLPGGAVELLLKDTEEETFKALKMFKEIIEESNKKVLKSKMNDNEFKPQEGKTSELSLEDFKKMGYTEKAKLQGENPALYEKLRTENRKSVFK